jgi:hypothetical protein
MPNYDRSSPRFLADNGWTEAGGGNWTHPDLHGAAVSKAMAALIESEYQKGNGTRASLEQEGHWKDDWKGKLLSRVAMSKEHQDVRSWLRHRGYLQ